jgi:hypothetical protein
MMGAQALFSLRCSLNLESTRPVYGPPPSLGLHQIHHLDWTAILYTASQMPSFSEPTGSFAATWKKRKRDHEESNTLTRP